MRRGLKFGIELFVDEEGAYTTLASAVSMLVVLTLLFSAATALAPGMSNPTRPVPATASPASPMLKTAASTTVAAV